MIIMTANRNTSSLNNNNTPDTSSLSPPPPPAAAVTTRSSSSRQTTTAIRNSVVAGYCAGVTGTLIGYPMDSIKVWLQTGSSHRRAITPTTNQQSPPSRAATKGSSASSQQSSTLRQQQQHNPRPPPTKQQQNVVQQLRQSSTWTHSTGHTIGHNKTTTAPLYLRKVQNNVRALYSGVTGPLMTVGLMQSIHFTIYDTVRRKLDPDNYPHDSLTSVATASLTSGSVLAVLTNPLMLIKTQQQTRQATFLQALSQTVRHSNNHTSSNSSGIRSQPSLITSSSLFSSVGRLYTGFIPHAGAEMGGRAVYFVLYEYLKRQLEDDDTGMLKLSDRMLAAGLSGMVCWTVIFPLDAIRCRMYSLAHQQQHQPSQQQQRHHHPPSPSQLQGSGVATTTTIGTTSSSSALWQTIQKMYCKGGITSFYRGLGVTMIRAGPVASCVLPVYDLTLQYLSSSSSSW